MLKKSILVLTAFMLLGLVGKAQFSELKGLGLVGGLTKKISYFDKKIWLTTMDDKVYYYDRGFFREYWGRGVGKEITGVEGGFEGVPYIIGMDNKIYKGTGNDFREIPGGGLAKKIYCENGKLWKIGMDDKIYSYNGSVFTQYWGNGLGKEITVFNGVPFIIGMDNKIYRGTRNGFSELPGGGLGKKIFCDKGVGKLWKIGMNDRIYSYNGKIFTEYPGGGLGKEITVATDGVPYIIGMGNKIYEGVYTLCRDYTTLLGIGDNYGGGIVAYILQPGDPGYDSNVKHGLIAAPSDQTTLYKQAAWGCDINYIDGADGEAIGTGNQNTIDIMNGCATAGIAARICGNLELNGYTDWFLPSKDELNKLYINKNTIGGFVGRNYLSSTESRLVGYYVWLQDFNYGYQEKRGIKEYTYNVRAVRAF